MSQQLERMFGRPSDNTSHDQELSFRTMKTFTHYNLTDFLPPSQPVYSRTLIASRPREKTHTEPAERQYREHEYNELKRKMELLEEEKLILKSALQRSESLIKEKNEVITTLKQEGRGKDQEINKLKKELAQKPRLGLYPNCLHLQLFPKFKQFYQVSVQTDPIIETVCSTPYSATNESSKPISTDKEMQSIYERLEGLKMGRKTSKIQTMKPSSQLFGGNIRVERSRAPSYQWNQWEDKENNMRTSNIPQPIQRETNVRGQKVREQCLDIYAIEQQKLQRILSDYFD